MANTVDAFIPEIWAKAILKNLWAKLLMANLCNHTYDGEIKEMGDTVHIPTITDLTVRDKVKGTAISFENLASTVIDMVVDEHKYFAFMVDDIEKVQANQDFSEAFRKSGGYGLAKAIDDIIWALYSSLTQSVGTGGTALTDAIFRDAIQTLDDNDVPEEDRFFVIAPSVKNTLLGIAKFVEAHKLGIKGPGPIVKGYFGEIYGIPVYVTTQVPTVTATVTTTYNLLFHREALACPIQRNIKMHAQWDIDYLANKIAGDVIFGKKILRDSAAVVVLT